MTPAPDRAILAAYLEMVFGYVDGEAVCIALRGTGEKGTGGEGSFIEPVILPADAALVIDRIFGHVQRWSLHGRASFIVPAAVDEAALTDHKATEDRIRFITTIVVDIDKGNTFDQLAHATKYMGAASMIVHSGGTTETGHAKVHAYWRLSEASARVTDIASARKVLALKIGGDASFGRSTQVIRIPGSIYSKGGVAKLCTIAEANDYEYELDDLLEAIAAMPAAPGVTVDEAKLLPAIVTASYSLGGKGLNFSGFASSGGDRDNSAALKATFTTDITEGGDGDRNRWGEFNRIAGKNIASVRQGIFTMDEARAHTETWMLEHMKPAWPTVRFSSEWKNLLAHDLKAKGPMATDRIAVSGAGKGVIDVSPDGTGTYGVPATLGDWSVSGWSTGEKPKRRFLVEGLVLAGKAHMLAAEGGAGKTFLLLDLALKIALHQPGREQKWCGMPLTDLAAGTVVMFTTEDDKDELHIRLTDIDPGNRRKEAGPRLVIIPTINIGGAFALVERERATGRAVLGQAWNAWLDQLRAVPDLRMVVIDTLNTTLHGEENSATVINEYVQAAAAVVCGELGAALVVTHHVRKPGANMKIYTAEDMKNSIRGSTALIGAFRVALGIWHAPDFKERLDRMGKDARPGNLYNLAVVKANNPEMAWDTRAMLRQPNGLLVDITESEKRMVAASADQAEAWMVKAVEYAAEKERPFTIKAAMKRPPNGRKHQLPRVLQGISERKISDLCERLLAEGRLVQCNPKGSTTFNHLDVPNGPLAKAMGADGGAYRIAEGADFDPPSWEHVFAFHPVDRCIVRKADLEKTLIKLGRAGSVAPVADDFEGESATDATGPQTSPPSQ